MNLHEHRIRLKKLKGGKHGFVKRLFYNFGNWINALFSAQINFCGHLSKRKYQSEKAAENDGEKISMKKSNPWLVEGYEAEKHFNRGINK